MQRGAFLGALLQQGSFERLLESTRELTGLVPQPALSAFDRAAQECPPLYGLQLFSYELIISPMP